MFLPSVLFYADLAQHFVPPDLDYRALGGSETALIEVARGLSRLGHRVTVVAHPGPKAGWYDGVEYVDVHSPEWRTRSDVDIAVVFRQLPHALRRIPGKLRLLWAHDHLGIYPEMPQGPRRRALELAWRWGYRVFGRYVPVVVTVSRWLGDCFVDYAGWPPDRVLVVPNGIRPEFFEPTLRGWKERPPNTFRVAYTSVPERGLELLASRVMPAVWQHNPNVELHVFSYRPLDRYHSLAVSSGGRIRMRGGLPKRELADVLAQFDLWLYPTDFPETSCIAAMEAQAAGLPVVSSRRYALPETVEHGKSGILVDGPVGSPPYIHRFVHATLSLLQDATQRMHMSQYAAHRILHSFTWDAAARQWSQLLQELWATRLRWSSST